MTVRSQLWELREHVSPVLRRSRFSEYGRITPEEFVRTGDYLVAHAPLWHWAVGEPSKRREYLPRDKQFLIVRGVPCLRRVSRLRTAHGIERLLPARHGRSKSLARVDSDAATHGGVADDTERLVRVGDEDWILTHVEAGRESDRPDLGAALRDAPHDSPAHDLGMHAPDEPDDPAQYNPGAAAGAEHVSVRTYDCMITYDKYYQTPRMWLIGYDENGLPLQPAQIFEDVASDYAFKTVTIEPFPHGSPGGGSMDHLLARRADHSRSPRSMAMHVASIHPCKHASMMHKMIARINDAASERGTDAAQAKPRTWAGAVRRLWGPSAEPANDEGAVQVDQYLIIFLKFMASIVPTIEIDAPHPV